MQISCAVTAQLISTSFFTTQIVQFLLYLFPKLQASSLLLQASLCGTWLENSEDRFSRVEAHIWDFQPVQTLIHKAIVLFAYMYMQQVKPKAQISFKITESLIFAFVFWTHVQYTHIKFYSWHGSTALYSACILCANKSEICICHSVNISFIVLIASFEQGHQKTCYVIDIDNRHS